MRNAIYIVLFLGMVGAVIYAVVRDKQNAAAFQDEMADVAATGELGIAYEAAVKVQVGLDKFNQFAEFRPGDTVTHGESNKTSEYSNAKLVLKVYPADETLSPFETEWYYPNLPMADVNAMAERAAAKDHQLFPIKYKKSKTEAGKYTVAQLDEAAFQQLRTEFEELEKRARENTSFLPAE